MNEKSTKAEVDGGTPSAEAQCSAAFLVFGTHNRHGEWLAAAYDNEAAAKAHSKHLDETEDAWENIAGGRVEKVDLLKTFTPPNPKLTDAG